MMKRIILASGSPRRKEILTQLGLTFTVIPSDADESEKEPMSPAETVCDLSRRKAEEVKNRLLAAGEDLTDTMIVGCDTVVVYDKHIIGKPADENEARLTLTLLSDSYHDVYSGLTLITSEKTVCDSERTHLKTVPMLPEEIDAYIKTGEPFGKAGSYGIQGLGCAFIEKLEGDYYNVMGFPVTLFCRLLKEEFDTSVFELGGKI